MLETNDYFEQNKWRSAKDYCHQMWNLSWLAMEQRSRSRNKSDAVSEIQLLLCLNSYAYLYMKAADHLSEHEIPMLANRYREQWMLWQYLLWLECCVRINDIEFIQQCTDYWPCLTKILSNKNIEPWFITKIYEKICEFPALRQPIQFSQQPRNTAIDLIRSILDYEFILCRFHMLLTWSKQKDFYDDSVIVNQIASLYVQSVKILITYKNSIPAEVMLKYLIVTDQLCEEGLLTPDKATKALRELYTSIAAALKALADKT